MFSSKQLCNVLTLMMELSICFSKGPYNNRTHKRLDNLAMKCPVHISNYYRKSLLIDVH